MAGLRRNGKRKLEEDDDDAAVVSDVIRLVSEANPEADDITTCLRRVYRLAKSDDKHVDLFFHFQAFPALLTLLEKEHDLQNLGLGACIIGRLANKPAHQDMLAKDGSLRFIVNLLERHHSLNTPHAYEVLCQAAHAITRLVHQHDHNKAIASVEGAIPFLVGLLKPTNDETVLKAATKALYTLALNNDAIKTQIVDCQALPNLVLLLWSDNYSICHEAVGLVSTLAHGSPQIQTQVCDAGALHPVIQLLSCTCSKRQIQAASLIGRLAANSNCKALIVQRGGLGPLFEMLQSEDENLKEMASYVLGRLAHDSNAHIQSGFVNAGGIAPLVKLLGSGNNKLQHNGAYVLDCLATSEDVVVALIRDGGVQKLIEGGFSYQPTKLYVANTITKLEEKIHVGWVKDLLLYLMHTSSDETFQRQILLALASLCSRVDQKEIFIKKPPAGIDSLLELLESAHAKLHRYACVALCRLAGKATLLSPVNAGPSPPISKVCRSEQYIDSHALSDVTFLVEGKRIKARKTLLCASSDVFRAMLDDGFMEKDAKEIKITHFGFEAFNLMMEYIHTGSVDLSNLRTAINLLEAADYYLLDDLRRLCENTIVQDINANNLKQLYNLSCVTIAVLLRNACCLFALKNFQELNSKAWYRTLLVKMLPSIKDYFVEMLVET